MGHSCSTQFAILRAPFGLLEVIPPGQTISSTVSGCIVLRAAWRYGLPLVVTASPRGARLGIAGCRTCAGTSGFTEFSMLFTEPLLDQAAAIFYGCFLNVLDLQAIAAPTAEPTFMFNAVRYSAPAFRLLDLIVSRSDYLFTRLPGASYFGPLGPTAFA